MKMLKIKRCLKCKRELPVNEFNKDRSRKDNFSDRCRKCRREYYQGHQEKISQQQRRYHEIYREGIAQRSKKRRGTIIGYLRCVFNDMNQRCGNPNAGNYKYYGGRGIQNRFKAADEFVSYVIDVLQVDPRGLQIDRIDNDGHYEKGNIRFVTREVNMNNRKHPKKVAVA